MSLAVSAPPQHGFPEFYLDCVVALGAEAEDGSVNWVASGFLYGHPVGPRSKQDDPAYQVYLVTNRHVFEGMQRMVVRFNPRGKKPAREFLLQLVEKNGTPAWLSHPDARIDVAVVPIDFKLLRRHSMAVAFFAGDRYVAPRIKWRALGVSEGNHAYVLGFPMGLVGGRRNTVIVRSGAVARIRDTMAGMSNEFLLDTFVFPGNSGGPVLLRCEDAPQLPPLLIGIIRAYVPYQDIAVSMQTERPRVIFEENSGLAAAHPIDYVISTIRRHLRSLSVPTIKGRKKRPRHPVGRTPVPASGP